MAVTLLARQAPPMPPRPPQEYLDENLAPKMLAVDGTIFGLAMLCVLLRIYVRAVMLKTFGVDDWIMMLAAVLSATCFSLFVTLTQHGVGHHAEYFTFVHPEYMSVFFKVVWWYAWIVVVAYTSIKLSIACFLLRLADHRRHWRWVLYTIMTLTTGGTVVLVLFTIGSVLSLILQCKPVAAAWDFTLRPPTGTATCYSVTTYRNTGLFNSIFNLFTDLLLAVLPVPMVWKLQANLRTRVSLCIVLGLGLFACGTAVYKIPLQYHFFEEADFSGKGAWYYIWQQIEMNVGIIAACLPTLKPLAAGFFGVVSALTSGERYGERYGSRYGSRGPSKVNSRPYLSNGYFKQEERSGTQSYNMDDLKGSTKRASRASPEFQFNEEYGKGTVTYMASGRRGSRAGESDESILPLQKGIMRTTEVQIR
ncbi:hypothetical protein EK21DRAFT_94032 [Setomelanomma holmii]|uniref:Rhodopsin domain-containing protein n=1 Tax=Setomelanomma holmii TaxID=210430 RepID=A0A9P4LHV0_9PLEO|nr:hypothetical protein EK21DRAFT_94032 [Setomelanomma holmii]